MNNYNNCRDYYVLLENNIFRHSIQLYKNYQKIISNLKNNRDNFEIEKYFLVNKAFISQIKQDLNFYDFCTYLKKGGVLNMDEINIFNAIKLFKNTPIDQLKLFFGNEGNLNYAKYYSLLNVNIISFKYYENNQEKCVMIYNDYEIIDKNTMKLFVDINNIENYLLNCIINEGKIMIFFPDDFDQEKKGITAIGKLSEDLNFVTEYILVYDSPQIRKQHTEYLYGNLNSFITNFQFVNHCQPIHDNKYNIVGTVIDYAQYDDSKNINTPVIVTPSTIPQSQPKNQSQFFNPNMPVNPENSSINPSIPETIIPPDKREIDKLGIRKSYIFPTLIGLQNIGATCYMNATLQCFCHIEKFVNFFKYNKQVKAIYENKMEDKLSYSFKILIEELWPNDQNNTSNKYYAPYDFKQKISKMNPLFEGVAANDSKDLVNFLIMTLHEELNKANRTSNLTDSTTSNLMIDQRNRELVFSNFFQNFMETNQSIISDLFYGVNCSVTQCQNCLASSFNYQTYFFLIFPLEEVRKFMMQYNPNIRDLVDIYDCFQYNQKIDFMTGDNSMYCNYCRQTCNSSMATNLTVCPEVLIIILNRGKGIEFKVKINFYEDLSLENFIEHKETGYKYKLIGVITHLGSSDMSGHFIAYCRDPISNDWYQFNDAIVNPVKNFKNEVIDYAMPYLLFYQKIT